MKEEEVVEVLEKEKQYMLSHGGDYQAKAIGIAIEIIKSAKGETYRDLLWEHLRAIEKIQREMGFPIKEITLVYESDSDCTYEL